MKTASIKSLFPIVYQRGYLFEILPELDLTRKDEVWGYEIMPGIILAKKCGYAAWDNVRLFAEDCVMNGKWGKLPSKEVLEQGWNEELEENIRKMDKFLCEKGIDAERDFEGILWCSEVDGRYDAYFFHLSGRYDLAGDKRCITGVERIAVAF